MKRNTRVVEVMWNVTSDAAGEGEVLKVWKSGNMWFTRDSNGKMWSLFKAFLESDYCTIIKESAGLGNDASKIASKLLIKYPYEFETVSNGFLIEAIINAHREVCMEWLSLEELKDVLLDEYI